MAVIEALCGAIASEAAIGNVTEVRPHATFTEMGTFKPDAVVETLTATPVIGAPDEIVATQLEEAPNAILVGLQLKLVND